MASIAFEHGFVPDTLWQHPENQRLRELRPNMFQLRVDDEVAIPALRTRAQQRPVDQRHRFRRRGVPETVRIQLWDIDGQPRTNLAYTLTIDGGVHEGLTDAEGRIAHWISPKAARAELVVHADHGDEAYELLLGTQEPSELDDSALARLRELGYLGPGEPTPAQLFEALRGLQRERGLTVSGDFDVETRRAMFDPQWRR